MINLKKSNNKNPTSRLYLFLVLMVGGICLAFSQGRWPIPLVTFAYLILMLHFINLLKSWIWFLGFLVVHTIAWDIAYTGLIPIPFPWRLIISFSFSLIIGLLFLLNRFVMRKSDKFYTTLIFPTGLVLFEFLIGIYGTGTGASIANTFSNQHAIAQLVSVTGWTGITFMVGWTSSVITKYLLTNQKQKKSYIELIYLGVVWAFILVYGHARLWNSYSGETVKIVCIVGESTLPKEGELRQHVLNYLKGDSLPNNQFELARNHIRKVIDRTFYLVEHAFNLGAKVVVFPEANPAITLQEEQYCQEYAKRLAVENNAYLGLGYYIFHHQENVENENKFVMTTPDGTITWEYFKAKQVPGSKHKTGDGILPFHKSEFGNLSAAICYDMDFPKLMKQAGKKKIDILFGPSNDWPAIKEIHVKMAKLRSIEQGYSLVRPTSNGFSFVTDPYGRILAYQNTNSSGEHVLTANVFTNGVTTIYSSIGDTFSWLCIGGFFILLIVIFIQSRGRKT